MNEYIERQKVFDSLPIVAEDKKISLYGAMADVMVLVSAIPAADVAPVIHGRWIEADDGDGVVCSECGTDFCTLIYRREDLKYCICGARMDGGDKDG